MVLIMTFPFVSIVIVNWNGQKHLERCLSSLEKIDYPLDRYEVLFIDNYSTDDSVNLVRTKYPHVKLYIFNENLGFAKANNRSIRYTNGEYIVFLNNDTEVTVDWLLKLINASTKYQVPICCSKTLFMSNPDVVHYCGANFTINGRGSSQLFLKRNSKGDSDFYTSYPCAASMLIKREVFIELGGFDEDYFACLDDTDLGWRAWLFGYKVLCCPSSIVYHAVGGTTGMVRVSPMRAFQGTKNALMNVLKNLEFKNVLSGVVFAIGYDLLEFLLLIGQGNVECAKGKLNGYIWVIKNWALILRKRDLIQNHRKRKDHWLTSHGLMYSLDRSIHEFLRLNRLDSKVRWNNQSKSANS